MFRDAAASFETVLAANPKMTTAGSHYCDEVWDLSKYGTCASAAVSGSWARAPTGCSPIKSRNNAFPTEWAWLVIETYTGTQSGSSQP